MSENISETSQTLPTEQNQKKRKVSAFNIIILVILLAIIGIAIFYFFGDESKLEACSLADECGRYNVFYISGQGYVCANDQAVGENTIKNKLLMFKYASKNAAANEPAECSCIENQCEAVE
ncbi:hypothetical protein J4437_08215 [Candidatus Woesearchaeota archaeon]|nr:hypothetical protein [Candidatus Woesearchaeota archaeon]